MKKSLEIELIDELLALKASGSAYLDDAVARNPVANYTSAERFEVERRKLFRSLPTAVAHVSELPEKGSFLRRDIGGAPILVTRDDTGSINAFLNVCRHRGTRLVDEEAGCKRRFSCPYHAWTYSSSGELIGAPHFDEGFDGLDRAELSLKRVNCAERFGFVWVGLGDPDRFDIDGWFEGLADDLVALGFPEMSIVAEDTALRRANWKILVEGGIEAYHFRVAHKATIGPHFEDNLSTFRTFGHHIRSVLPRTSMGALTNAARNTWRLRDHANVLYTLLPTTQFLVMQDHVVWLSSEPISPSETILRIATLAPTASVAAKDDAHWMRNHQITMTTLDEDFVIGESMQESADSGANADMLFGRFESALCQFNRVVEGFVD